jgi:cell division protein FtsW
MRSVREDGSVSGSAPPPEVAVRPERAHRLHLLDPGEELGLLGEIVVLIAFGALIFAGIRIAANAKDVFGRLLAAGIVSWFGLQTLINLGAVTGLLPVTGVPLPFLSYGGSSLVVSLAAVGVLVSIARTPARANAVVRNHRAGSPRDVLRYRPKVGADPCRRAERPRVEHRPAPEVRHGERARRGWRHGGTRVPGDRARPRARVDGS